MLIETLSTKLTKALSVSPNSQNSAWTTLSLQNTAPTGDGVWRAGGDGEYAPNRVFLLPYCEGPAGARFSMRVYSWRDFGGPDLTPPRQTWIPSLLAEFACTAGNNPGLNLLDINFTPYIGPTENMCDTIALTQGALGKNGLISSTGPGTNLIAAALLDLTGCRYFQFDFQYTDAVSMNCAWARC